MIINKDHKSPNFSERNTEIDTIIFHFTDMDCCKEAIDLLCNKENEASAHYVISESGEIFELVDPKLKANHAGISYWQGRHGLNANSIGIEIDNRGYKDGKFTEYKEKQIDALWSLCDKLTKDFKIKYFLGHSDIAPDRKIDPGPLFPWNVAESKGFGQMPKVALLENPKKLFTLGEVSDEISQFRKNLAKIGYMISESNEFDAELLYVNRAFNHHYYPNGKDELVDENALLLSNCK